MSRSEKPLASAQSGGRAVGSKTRTASKALSLRDALIRAAGIFGFAGVALGAFGAHGLQKLLEQNETAAIWQTAVFYHLVHSVACLFAAKSRPAAAIVWMIGILIFSGSLYILAISNIRWLGAITPVGGLLLLGGWALLCWNPGKK